MNKYTLYIRAEVRQEGYGGGLQVEERFEVKADSFLELCQILGRFHELAEKVKAGENARRS